MDHVLQLQMLEAEQEIRGETNVGSTVSFQACCFRNEDGYEE
ncbi:MAG: hypothetical protein ABWZ54_12485 [Luteibacter sp.]|jgi:hypothetical protein